MNPQLYKSSFLFLLSFFFLASCKTTKLTKENELLLSQSTRAIKVLPRFFDIDKLGNIVVVDESNKLIMYDANGTKKYDMADNRYGPITSIDLSNPLNIVVFYKGLGIIRILDNTLAQIKVISLQQNGKFSSAGPVCIANDNNFWVFDPLLQKIVKIDQNLKTLAETNQFRDLGMPNFIPESIVERNNQLVASNTNEGFVIFDNFGQMTNKIIASQVLDFQFDGVKILYHCPTGMKIQTLEVPSAYTVGLPSGIEVEKIEEIKLEKERWYFMYKDGIDWAKRGH